MILNINFRYKLVGVIIGSIIAAIFMCFGIRPVYSGSKLGFLAQPFDGGADSALDHYHSLTKHDVVIEAKSNRIFAHKNKRVNRVVKPEVLSSDVESPSAFLNDNFNKLQAAIKQSGASYQHNRAKLYQVTETIVLPIVDVDMMAGSVVGPKWRRVSKQDRQEFIKQFSKILTRAYAISLLKVSDYQVDVMPLRGDGWKSKQVVAMKAKIINKNNQEFSRATFYLQRFGNSWRVFDLAVEGVSIVKNFRAQFQGFADIASLLVKLRQVNQAAAKNS